MLGGQKAQQYGGQTFQEGTTGPFHTGWHENCGQLGRQTGVWWDFTRSWVHTLFALPGPKWVCQRKRVSGRAQVGDRSQPTPTDCLQRPLETANQLGLGIPNEIGGGQRGFSQRTLMALPRFTRDHCRNG